MALTGKQEAFRVDTIATGFDHQRSQVRMAFGHHVANSTTTFQASMLVDLNSSQEIIKSVGSAPFGWSKYNKESSLYGAIVGEYIQLNGVVATSLAHANLRPAAAGVAGVRVGSALASGAFTEGAGSDYVVNYTNGTVVRPAGSTIADGGYVFVSYQYLLTSQEVLDLGQNFWNGTDDVTIQGGKVTVAQGAGSIVFTTAFDTSITYAIGDTLTAGTTAEVLEGLVTVGGAGGNVGTVIQVPTADDPFLGIKSSI